MPTYHKLVRDRIPEIIQSTGKELKTEILNDARYIEELKKKLTEEVTEYQEATSDEEALEELADVLELMHALAKQHGATIDEVEKIRKDKAEKRGAFNEKIYLIEVEDD
ncbi:nucleoside triphosphate pyrophosphohydrolase [Virgibacillus halodenitrificans]|uniref:Nucleoside triphosphate pyrophosphohydrolase n=1 Tax=Virgibacillus halodenitrificans TaxID=1482 RepID=A0ABR7VNN6_VIRHA|nr:nucleoside triphosphate pyrophosphohydrolase [Virgibacillus halodenitrificans]MBD1222142.1 nucleoside triphosphate pyrophosphohydrolase [Virgibacillus halodenitrificans]